MEAVVLHSVEMLLTVASAVCPLRQHIVLYFVAYNTRLLVLANCSCANACVDRYLLLLSLPYAQYACKLTAQSKRKEPRDWRRALPGLVSAVSKMLCAHNLRDCE